MNKDQSNEILTEAEKVGIDSAVRLSYGAVDRADIPDEKKRRLLFSVYSFRCLFDQKEMSYIHPVLKKYNCTFSCPAEEHPFYHDHPDEFAAIVRDKTRVIPYGGLYIQDGNGYAVRYDAGSPVWQELKARGQLQKNADTVPEKYDLYELCHEIIRLNTADAVLRAAWYLTFPYVMMLDAPHDPDLYEIIYETLARPEIFEKVLSSPYGVYVRDSTEELLSASDLPAAVIEWYLPYVAYKNEKDETGCTREEKRFRAWLSEGRFTEVYAGTEKLLDTFPDDDGILLCNVAARISLDAAVDESAKRALLQETLGLIESALERGSAKKIYFLYYAGLAHLGLKNLDAAREQFRLCQETDADFHPAQIMLTALTQNKKPE